MSRILCGKAFFYNIVLELFKIGNCFAAAADNMYLNRRSFFKFFDCRVNVNFTIVCCRSFKSHVKICLEFGFFLLRFDGKIGDTSIRNRRYIYRHLVPYFFTRYIDHERSCILIYIDGVECFDEFDKTAFHLFSIFEFKARCDFAFYPSCTEADAYFKLRFEAFFIGNFHLFIA